MTRKITRAATRIKLGFQDFLYLGNLDVRRDWGFAGDYVQAMWLMLQQESPDDFVIATGEDHSVQEFCELTFDSLGMDWLDYVRFDERYLRPSEVHHLCVDASKARCGLGWSPETSFETLVELMVREDSILAEEELFLREHNGRSADRTVLTGDAASGCVDFAGRRG